MHDLIVVVYAQQADYLIRVKLTLKRLKRKIREEVDRLVRNSAGFGGASMRGDGQPLSDIETTIGNDELHVKKHEEPTQVGARQQARAKATTGRRKV